MSPTSQQRHTEGLAAGEALAYQDLASRVDDDGVSLLDKAQDADHYASSGVEFLHAKQSEAEGKKLSLSDLAGEDDFSQASLQERVSMIDRMHDYNASLLVDDRPDDVQALDGVFEENLSLGDSWRQQVDVQRALDKGAYSVAYSAAHGHPLLRDHYSKMADAYVSYDESDKSPAAARALRVSLAHSSEKLALDSKRMDEASSYAANIARQQMANEHSGEGVVSGVIREGIQALVTGGTHAVNQLTGDDQHTPPELATQSKEQTEQVRNNLVEFLASQYPAKGHVERDEMAATLIKDARIKSGDFAEELALTSAGELIAKPSFLLQEDADIDKGLKAFKGLTPHAEREWRRTNQERGEALAKAIFEDAYENDPIEAEEMAELAGWEMSGAGNTVSRLIDKVNHFGSAGASSLIRPDAAIKPVEGEYRKAVARWVANNGGWSKAQKKFQSRMDSILYGALHVAGDSVSALEDLAGGNTALGAPVAALGKHGGNKANAQLSLAGYMPGSEFVSDLAGVVPDIALSLVGGGAAIKLGGLFSKSSVAASRFGAAGASASSGVGVGVSTYSDAIRAGKTKTEAAKLAGMAALITTGITALGAKTGTEALVTGGFNKAAAKSHLAKSGVWREFYKLRSGQAGVVGQSLTKHGGAEGIEEFFDEFLQSVFVSAEMYPHLTLSDHVQAGVHAAQLGAAAGGVTASIAEVPNSVASFNDAFDSARIEAREREAATAANYAERVDDAIENLQDAYSPLTADALSKKARAEVASIRREGIQVDGVQGGYASSTDAKADVREQELTDDEREKRISDAQSSLESLLSSTTPDSPSQAKGFKRVLQTVGDVMSGRDANQPSPALVDAMSLVSETANAYQHARNEFKNTPSPDHQRQVEAASEVHGRALQKALSVTESETQARAEAAREAASLSKDKATPGATSTSSKPTGKTPPVLAKKTSASPQQGSGGSTSSAVSSSDESTSTEHLSSDVKAVDDLSADTGAVSTEVDNTPEVTIVSRSVQGVSVGDKLSALSPDQLQNLLVSTERRANRGAMVDRDVLSSLIDDIKLEQKSRNIPTAPSGAPDSVNEQSSPDKPKDASEATHGGDKRTSAQREARQALDNGTDSTQLTKKLLTTLAPDLAAEMVVDTSQSLMGMKVVWDGKDAVGMQLLVSPNLIDNTKKKHGVTSRSTSAEKDAVATHIMLMADEEVNHFIAAKALGWDELVSAGQEVLASKSDAEIVEAYPHLLKRNGEHDDEFHYRVALEYFNILRQRVTSGMSAADIVRSLPSKLRQAFASYLKAFRDAMKRSKTEATSPLLQKQVERIIAVEKEIASPTPVKRNTETSPLVSTAGSTTTDDEGAMDVLQRANEWLRITRKDDFNDAPGMFSITPDTLNLEVRLPAELNNFDKSVRTRYKVELPTAAELQKAVDDLNASSELRHAAETVQRLTAPPSSPDRSDDLAEISQIKADKVRYISAKRVEDGDYNPDEDEMVDQMNQDILEAYGRNYPTPPYATPFSARLKESLAALTNRTNPTEDLIDRRLGQTVKRARLVEYIEAEESRVLSIEERGELRRARRTLLDYSNLVVSRPSIEYWQKRGYNLGKGEWADAERDAIRHAHIRDVRESVKALHDLGYTPNVGRSSRNHPITNVVSKMFPDTLDAKTIGWMLHGDYMSVQPNAAMLGELLAMRQQLHLRIGKSRSNDTTKAGRVALNTELEAVPISSVERLAISRINKFLKMHRNVDRDAVRSAYHKNIGRNDIGQAYFLLLEGEPLPNGTLQFRTVPQYMIGKKDGEVAKEKARYKALRRRAQHFSIASPAAARLLNAASEGRIDKSVVERVEGGDPAAYLSVSYTSNEGKVVSGYSAKYGEEHAKVEGMRNALSLDELPESNSNIPPLLSFPKNLKATSDIVPTTFNKRWLNTTRRLFSAISTHAEKLTQANPAFSEVIHPSVLYADDIVQMIDTFYSNLEQQRKALQKAPLKARKAMWNGRKIGHINEYNSISGRVRDLSDILGEMAVQTGNMKYKEWSKHISIKVLDDMSSTISEKGMSNISATELLERIEDSWGLEGDETFKDSTQVDGSSRVGMDDMNERAKHDDRMAAMREHGFRNASAKKAKEMRAVALAVLHDLDIAKAKRWAAQFNTEQELDAELMELLEDAMEFEKVVGITPAAEALRVVLKGDVSALDGGNLSPARSSVVALPDSDVSSDGAEFSPLDSLFDYILRQPDRKIQHLPVSQGLSRLSSTNQKALLNDPDIAVDENEIPVVSPDDVLSQFLSENYKDVPMFFYDGSGFDKSSLHYKTSLVLTDDKGAVRAILVDTSDNHFTRGDDDVTKQLLLHTLNNGVSSSASAAISSIKSQLDEALSGDFIESSRVAEAKVLVASVRSHKATSNTPESVAFSESEAKALYDQHYAIQMEKLVPLAADVLGYGDKKGDKSPDGTTFSDMPDAMFIYEVMTNPKMRSLVETLASFNPSLQADSLGVGKDYQWMSSLYLASAQRAFEGGKDAEASARIDDGDSKSLTEEDAQYLAQSMGRDSDESYDVVDDDSIEAPLTPTPPSVVDTGAQALLARYTSLPSDTETPLKTVMSLAFKAIGDKRVKNTRTLDDGLAKVVADYIGVSGRGDSPRGQDISKDLISVTAFLSGRGIQAIRNSRYFTGRKAVWRDVQHTSGRKANSSDIGLTSVDDRFASLQPGADWTPVAGPASAVEWEAYERAYNSVVATPTKLKPLGGLYHRLREEFTSQQLVQAKATDTLNSLQDAFDEVASLIPRLISERTELDEALVSEEMAPEESQEIHEKLDALDTRIDRLRAAAPAFALKRGRLLDAIKGAQRRVDDASQALNGRSVDEMADDAGKLAFVTQYEKRKGAEKAKRKQDAAKRLNEVGVVINASMSRPSAVDEGVMRNGAEYIAKSLGHLKRDDSSTPHAYTGKDFSLGPEVSTAGSEDVSPIEPSSTPPTANLGDPVAPRSYPGSSPETKTRGEELQMIVRDKAYKAVPLYRDAVDSDVNGPVVVAYNGHIATLSEISMDESLNDKMRDYATRALKGLLSGDLAGFVNDGLRAGAFITSDSEQRAMLDGVNENFKDKLWLHQSATVDSLLALDSAANLHGSLIFGQLDHGLRGTDGRNGWKRERKALSDRLTKLYKRAGAREATRAYAASQVAAVAPDSSSTHRKQIERNLDAMERALLNNEKGGKKQEGLSAEIRAQKAPVKQVIHKARTWLKDNGDMSGDVAAALDKHMLEGLDKDALRLIEEGRAFFQARLADVALLHASEGKAMGRYERYLPVRGWDVNNELGPRAGVDEIVEFAPSNAHMRERHDQDQTRGLDFNPLRAITSTANSVLYQTNTFDSLSHFKHLFGHEGSDTSPPVDSQWDRMLAARQDLSTQEKEALKFLNDHMAKEVGEQVVNDLNKNAHRSAAMKLWAAASSLGYRASLTSVEQMWLQTIPVITAYSVTNPPHKTAAMIRNFAAIIATTPVKIANTLGADLESRYAENVDALIRYAAPDIHESAVDGISEMNNIIDSMKMKDVDGLGDKAKTAPKAFFSVVNKFYDGMFQMSTVAPDSALVRAIWATEYESLTGERINADSVAHLDPEASTLATKYAEGEMAQRDSSKKSRLFQPVNHTVLEMARLAIVTYSNHVMSIMPKARVGLTMMRSKDPAQRREGLKRVADALVQVLAFNAMKMRHVAFIAGVVASQGIEDDEEKIKERDRVQSLIYDKWGSLTLSEKKDPYTWEKYLYSMGVKSAVEVGAIVAPWTGVSAINNAVAGGGKWAVNLLTGLPIPGDADRHLDKIHNNLEAFGGAPGIYGSMLLRSFNLYATSGRDYEWDRNDFILMLTLMGGSRETRSLMMKEIGEENDSTLYINSRNRGKKIPFFDHRPHALRNHPDLEAPAGYKYEEPSEEFLSGTRVGAVADEWEVRTLRNRNRPNQNDGDSRYYKDGFMRGNTYRLSGVDAMETKAQGVWAYPRAYEQGQDVDISLDDVVFQGKAAAHFTQEFTRDAKLIGVAKGEKVVGGDRIYTHLIVEKHGQRYDMASVLVKNGLARVHGAKNKSAMGYSGEGVKARYDHLKKLEADAKKAKRGIWGR